MKGNVGCGRKEITEAQLLRWRVQGENEKLRTNSGDKSHNKKLPA
jgi:hypothetical protein